MVWGRETVASLRTLDRGRSPAAPSQTAFHGVQISALNTRYYGTLMSARGLGTPDAAARLSSVEDALARLPLSHSVSALAGLRRAFAGEALRDLV